MPNFEKLNTDPIEVYKKTEQDEAGLKAELTGAKTADEIMAIATKLKTIEEIKKGLVDTAHEEAIKEEEERERYDEAKKENDEMNMYDEAKAEDTQRTMYDEAKTEDVVRTQAKEIEIALDAALENLRSQIVDKDPDEILKIAAEIKKIENKKKENSRILAGTEADTEREIFESKGAGVKTELSEKEKTIESLRFQYDKIIDKIISIEETLKKLRNEREELFDKQRELKNTGDKDGQNKITENLKENWEQQERLKMGDKRYETNEKIKILSNQIEEAKKEKQPADKIEAIMAEWKKIVIESNKAEEKRFENWEENGLDGLKIERERLISEFKKQYGFDETAAKEMGNKFYGSAGRTDMNRIVINNYLGTELPIFSKDFRLGKYRDSQRGERHFVIADNSEDGEFNKTLLAKKQIEIYQNAMEANKAVKGISKSNVEAIFKECRLELDALGSIENNDGVNIEKNFYEIYSAFAGKGGGKINDMFITPEDKFYPGQNDLEKISGEKYPDNFRKKAEGNSLVTFNSLFLYKIAKEKGLL